MTPFFHTGSSVGPFRRYKMSEPPTRDTKEVIRAKDWVRVSFLRLFLALACDVTVDYRMYGLTNTPLPPPPIRDYYMIKIFYKSQLTISFLEKQENMIDNTMTKAALYSLVYLLPLASALGSCVILRLSFLSCSCADNATFF